VNSARAAQLLDINRQFYREHARDFAETRGRVQPGIRRVLQSLRADDSVLDLGCGNGAFARALSQRGHDAPYLGLDFSPGLLEKARSGRYDFPVTFREADLALPEQWPTIVRSIAGIASIESGQIARVSWAVLTAFAVMHHIPGQGLRLGLLRQARGLLQLDGRLILSNWQFSANSRMRSHIVPWSAAGLSPDGVDEGDYLIDWRRGAPGLRYVHEFSKEELGGLAAASGFRIADSFFSDGADGRSGLYQTWHRT
jgi:tRNA (uracil-5-)-methyltransferase TRM9